MIAWGEGFDAERVPTGDGDIVSVRGVLQKDRLHPAEKPVGLMTMLIDKHNDAETVVDFHAGSAPVAVSATILGRKYLAFEIDPDTAEMARQRVRETQPPLFVPEPEQMALNLTN